MYKLIRVGLGNLRFLQVNPISTLTIGAAECTLRIGAAGCTLTVRAARCGLVEEGGVLGPHLGAWDLPSQQLYGFIYIHGKMNSYILWNHIFKNQKNKKSEPEIWTVTPIHSTAASYYPFFVTLGVYVDRWEVRTLKKKLCIIELPRASSFFMFDSIFLTLLCSEQISLFVTMKLQSKMTKKQDFFPGPHFPMVSGHSHGHQKRILNVPYDS